MIKFLRTTPYIGTLNYCNTILAKLEKEHNNKPITFKVSVIIPFFNRSEMTVRALKSVFKQSYNIFEIILINDGSTDDIRDLRDIVKKHKNIRMIDVKKNTGPAAARNIGIKESKGEYVAFLDSDDEFLENKIEHQLAEMIKHNPYISYTSYIRRDENSDVIMSDSRLTGIVVPRIIRGASIATPTVIVNKKLLNDNNIQFNEDIRVGEDSCFWLEIAKYSEILLVDEPLTIVNVDTNSTAFNEEKTITGIKNILIYLLTDEYYSNYNSDISWVCDNFHKVNQDLLVRRNHGSIHNSSPVITGLRRYATNTIPYRVARRLYIDGPKGLARAFSKRIKK
jgi:glycosyltransferase involved in cell wall biosynthesis